jgi:phosphopantothenoylcysteine decarboxylase/phosphopantothenate--cysteine ligase
VNPDEGYLACGMTGAGRLASPECIAQAVFETLGLCEDLTGEIILVTAGPTEEPLDAVRYISNRSSGKMGYALAEASRRRGARVLLVSGPTRMEPPAAHTFERVRTAAEMAEAVSRHAHTATVVLMAAAVADFRPTTAHTGKIKRQDGAPLVNLEPTVDILADISRQRRDGQIIVGFAAETEHLVRNAAAKLRAKRLDLLVANDVSQEGAGFDVDTNIVTLLFPDGRETALEKMSKLEVANRVLDEVVEIRRKSGVRSPGSEVEGKK